MDFLFITKCTIYGINPIWIILLLLAVIAYGFYSPAGRANYRKQLWRDKHMKKWKKERGYK